MKNKSQSGVSRTVSLMSVRAICFERRRFHEVQERFKKHEGWITWDRRFSMIVLRSKSLDRVLLGCIALGERQGGWGLRAGCYWSAELLEAQKRVENGVVGMVACGLTVDEEASNEASAASSAAHTLLQLCFPSVLQLLQRGDDSVCVCLTPFLAAYLTQLKVVQKRSSGLFPVSDSKAPANTHTTNITPSTCHPTAVFV